MILTPESERAISAVVHLVARNTTEPVNLRELADECDTSLHAMTQISHKLVKAGIWTSKRGARGGVLFARSPENLTFFDVLIAIDGTKPWYDCFLTGQCSSTFPCPMHHKWIPIKQNLRVMLSDHNLVEAYKQMASSRWLQLTKF